MAFTLTQAHAIMMILGFMFFGSIGTIFARYGRTLRFGHRRQLLGKAVWFQIHRLFLTITSMLILLGFFFILVRAGGKWTDPRSSLTRFAHSVLGGISICCSILQIWFALYRCNPHSRFRFIFDWSHRIIGAFMFILSIPTFFLIIVPMNKSRIALITILSIWTASTIIITIIFEKIQFQQRITASTAVNDMPRGDKNQQNANAQPDTEAGTNTNVGNHRHNQIKLLLFFIYTIISLILSILLIIFLCL